MDTRTLQSVIEKIKRYRTRTEFMANCKADYAWLKANGLEGKLDELRPRLNAQADEITLDYVLSRAERCSSYSEFQSSYYRLYKWAKETGHLAEVEKILPPVSYQERALRSANTKRYTDQELVDHAKQFKNRADWRAAGVEERRVNSYSHYGAALKRGRDFMRQCCAHMPDERGKHVTYTYSDKDLLDSARKFQTRGEWKRQDRNTCEAARSRPIWDECVAHMRPAANPFAKDYTVYAYEFPDGHCYVGLSVVPTIRRKTHALRGPVFDHTALCPDPVYKTLATGLSFEEAIAAEGQWQSDYKANGWLALHKAKAGSLGSIKTTSKWTKETVLADAKRFATKQAWIDGSQVSYRIAKREGWFDEASAHMPKRVLGIGVGVNKTPEAREKMRQAKLGKAQPDAAKQAKSDAIKKWWADRKAAKVVETVLGQ